MTLYINQGAAATAKLGMHLWIWMLQMHNANSLTTVLYIIRINVQYAILIAKKDILHVIVTLKRKTIVLQDLYTPSINHDHHCITSIRPQSDHKVLMAHLAHVGATITVSVLLITGMSPHCRSLSYLHHSIHVCLQQGHRGVHLHHILDQKTDCGNPYD